MARETILQRALCGVTLTLLAPHRSMGLPVRGLMQLSWAHGARLIPLSASQLGSDQTHEALGGLACPASRSLPGATSAKLLLSQPEALATLLVLQHLLLGLLAHIQG